MLLRPYNSSLSSTLSYAPPFQIKIPALSLPQSKNAFRQNSPTITCSVSKVHNYGTVDYERRPSVKWNAIYKKISMMKNPELGSASVLNACEDEGQTLTKWELSRVVKELRRFKRYKPALEVYEWMNNRGERFRMSSSDAAIQLDLIAKVYGVDTAEDFFMKVPDTIKDKRVYGALLNSYVRARKRDKAESLIARMREKGYVMDSLPYNVMMTLYMNLKEYGKVDAVVSEMMEKNIRLDLYTYNIWLSSCGSEGSAEKMEQAFEQMKLDKSINPNWSTFSTMATMYIKMDLMEKAEECLRKVESRITGRDRIPFHYLISLYGSIGNKKEVYRVWSTYKTIFPSIPNLGYHAMISSLIRIGDIEGAEKVYEEWLPVRTSYDPRIANLLMTWYVKEGDMDKAETIFDFMREAGTQPTATTWEILAEGHISKRRIPEALSCFKEAFLIGSKVWKPKPVNASAFFDLCEDGGDSQSKETLLELLWQSGFLKDKSYASDIGISIDALSSGDNVFSENDEADGANDSDEDALAVAVGALQDMTE